MTTSRNYYAMFQVEPTDERIDIDRLKVHEKIGFYCDLMLYEDELHDSGCSMLSVKIVNKSVIFSFLSLKIDPFSVLF